MLYIYRHECGLVWVREREGEGKRERERERERESVQFHRLDSYL